jgi:uncharacterized membrane protein HdeD (DUF308 family)
MPKSSSGRFVGAALFALAGIADLFVSYALGRERPLFIVSGLLFIIGGILTGISAFRQKTPAKP